MAHRDKSTRIVRKLRETGDLYRELFNSINVCVAIYRVKDDGADFTIRDLNTAAETLEKVNRLDVIGGRILEVFPGFQEFGIFEVMQRVWQTGVPEHLPARFYQKDKKTGGWRDSYVYKSPSEDIVVVYEDITGRKKSEDALKETEQRYKTVADFTYDWEFWYSPEGKVLYISPACERISGYPPGHFIKDRRLMERIILTEDKEIWAAHIESVREPVEERTIFRIRRKDGAVCWIEHYCRPIFDENGGFLGIRGANRDITVLREAEKQTRESEERFMTAFNVNPDPVAITEVNTGRIILVNPAYEKWSGFSRSELIGATTKELHLWVNPDDRNRVTNQLQKCGEVTDVEVRLRTKDGTGHEVLFSANFVEMNGIRYMFSRRHILQ